MNHNNLKRTGWNSNETILAAENVSSGNFGKIFSRDVDDQIYAQPLVFSNVPVGGGIHNIVLVATVNNSLYAFDADDPNASTPYWQDNLTYDPANYRPIKNTDMPIICSPNGGGYKDFSGNMGIVGTPVIDKVTKTLYVVSRSVTKTGTPVFVQYLHAIDITTGAEKSGSPVYITATYPGNGEGNVNGLLTFNQQKQNQRPGLLLYNGVVYICWASHCDWNPYQGWVIGYDASTLEQKYVYNDVPNGNFAGIWMSGQPPSVDDDGNIYVTTGNGSTGYNGNPNDTINRGSSLLKLSSKSGKLKVVDFFTPMNYEYLNSNDKDYGINGALLIPDTHLSLSGSKDGGLYLIDNDKMGGTTTDNSNVLERLNMGDWGSYNSRHLHGSPVYFKDQYNNEYIYGWAEGGLLKQIPFIRSQMRFDTINAKIGITDLPGYMPGAMLSISSNGSQHGTGILWASHVSTGNPNQSVVPGMLQAFDATDVTHELWNSNWNSKRDSIGMFAKFVPPTIANGKVYMATFSKKLEVYGLNPPPVSSCSRSLPPMWQSADIGYVAYPGDVCVNNGVFTISSSGTGICGTADAFHYAFQKVITNETELTARVVSINSSRAKCGIMFRQNLDPGSPFVFFSLTPSDSIYFQKRASQRSSFANISSSITGSAPYWVRIFNKDNKYISYISSNGNEWTPVDSVTLALGPNSYVGIAYTTGNNNVLDSAVIDNITLTLGGALPVNLTNFNGRNVEEKYAMLNWTTSGEIMVDHFEIERSTSNTDFKRIGSVQGNRTSSKAFTYSFRDNFPYDGANFYRIKQVDTNGTATYSKVVPINFNLRKIEIFPNPVQHHIYIRNNSKFSNNKKLKIKLLDYSGKIFYKWTNVAFNDNIIPLTVPSNILNGMYIIIVTNNNGEKQGQQIFINR